MKKRLFKKVAEKIFIIFLLLIFVIIVADRSIGKTGQNILLNSDFEEGMAHLAFWEVEGGATVIWTLPWHTYRTPWSFGVGNDLDWAQDNAYGRCFQVLRNPENSEELYPVTPGEIFTFKMWMMTEEGYRGKAFLRIEFFDYDRRMGFFGKPLASFQSKIHTGEVTWKWFEESVRATAPEGAVSVVVSCVSEDMERGSKYVFFDSGVVITKILFI